MISMIHRIKASIPSYIQESYPKFADFIIKYYEYMEEEGPIQDLISFNENIYGIKQDQDYVRRFLADMGFDLGVNLNLDPDLQYKIINDFFSMRGSEPSLKLLFKLLFNEDVQIEYPRDKLFYLSDANYTKNKFLITTAPDTDNIPDVTFAGLVGLTSKSTATIENIDIIVSDKKYYLIECSFATGDFVIDEVIRIMLKDSNIDVVNTGGVNIEVDTCGNGYKKFDAVNISGCYQTGVGYVNSVTKGSIESMYVIKPGKDYKVGDQILAKNGFYSKVTEVDETGGIKKVELKHGGYKYQEYPELVYYTEQGTGALIELYGSQVGGVRSIVFENPYAICSNSIIHISSVSGYGFEGTVVPVPSINLNKWTDQKGFLGINCVLQDSDTFHEFSYRIVSNVPSERYIDVVDEFTHPYGFVRVPVLQTVVDMDFEYDNFESDVDVIIEKIPVDPEPETPVDEPDPVDPEPETPVDEGEPEVPVDPEPEIPDNQDPPVDDPIVE